MSNLGLASCHLGMELNLSEFWRRIDCLVFCIREGAGRKSRVPGDKGEKYMKNHTNVHVLRRSF